MARVWMWMVAAGCLLAGVASIRHDPRTLRSGVLLTVGLLSLLSGGLAAGGPSWQAATPRGWLLVAAVPLCLVGTMVLAVSAAGFGYLMVRRRRTAAAAGLGAVALGLLVIVVWGICLVPTGSTSAIAGWLLVSYLPGYLGIGLLALWGYGAVFRRWLAGRRLARVVIVLGAGLRGRSVSPQLASRLELGRVELARLDPHSQPVLVVSGGRGPDEVISEAEAMRNYLLARGVPDVQIRTEDQSRNTHQNLQFSRKLLATAGIDGPVVVASSSFHQFRTAMLLRRWGIDGFTVGCRAPWYLWPGAIMREFAAILRDHPVSSVVSFAIGGAALVWAWVPTLG